MTTANLDPEDIEIFESRGQAFIDLDNGQRYMLNEQSSPTPRELKDLKRRAIKDGRNLTVSFTASAGKYIEHLRIVPDVETVPAHKPKP